MSVREYPCAFAFAVWTFPPPARAVVPTARIAATPRIADTRGRLFAIFCVTISVLLSLPGRGEIDPDRGIRILCDLAGSHLPPCRRCSDLPCERTEIIELYE